MKEYIVIQKDSKKQWEETFKIPDHVDPETFAKKIISDYNSYADANRQFVCFKRQRKENVKRVHVWDKVSLVTERGGYDKMKCTFCGATGKRHGLGQNGVAADSKFDQHYCKIKNKK